MKVCDQLTDNLSLPVSVKMGNYRRVILRALILILGMRVILLSAVINRRTQMAWLHSLIMKNRVHVPITLLLLVFGFSAHCFLI